MILTERAVEGLHSEILSKVISILEDKDDTILDVGCGTGAFLERLKKAGYTSLFGVDILPPSTLNSVTFLRCDLDYCKLDLKDESIKLVTSIEVFEHIENIGLLLDELYRVIIPDGLMLITTPNLHSVESKIRLLLTGNLRQFDSKGDPTHIAPIFLYPFERILQRHGFHIASSWGYPRRGLSPTSRFYLKALAGIARFIGAKDGPRGDQLCILVKKSSDISSRKLINSKVNSLTSHYM